MGSGARPGLLASTLLVEHTALVAVWAVTAAALAALAEPTRLHLAASVFSGLALACTLYELAPPAELFSRQPAPADGVRRGDVPWTGQVLPN